MIWRRAATWLVALVLCAGAAELTARVDDWIRFRTPFSFGGAIESLQLRDSLTVRGRPHGRYKHFALDSLGFRGPEIAREPDPRCRRLMTLGASETFGFTEPSGKEFPAQLADSLRRHGCFEVVNAAIMGITGPNVIRFWTEWARRFRPGIVLFYPTPRFYLSNDPPTPVAAASPERGTHALWWRSRIFARLKDWFEVPERLQAWRSRRQLARLAARQPAGWYFTRVPEDRLDQFRRDVDSLVAAVRSSGADIVLLTHATRFRSPPTAGDLRILSSWRTSTPRATETTILDFERAANRAVAAVARERSVRMVDLAARLDGHPEYFVDAAHFTPAGSGVMAAALRDSLVAWFGNTQP